MKKDNKTHNTNTCNVYERCKMKREQKDVAEDGLSYQEIGAILGISPAEVKMIEQTALKKLRVPCKKNKKLQNYYRS